MIALTREDGTALRVFDPREDGPITWHSAHGFVTERTLQARQLVRRRGGAVTARRDEVRCTFRFIGGEPHGVDDCTVAAIGPGRPTQWRLETAHGDFFLKPLAAVTAPVVTEEDDLVGRKLLLSFAAVMVLIVGLGIHAAMQQDLFSDPMKTLEAQQKTVLLPKAVAKVVPPPPPKEEKKPEAVVQKPKNPGTAVKNKLSFLALLGRPDLKKAVGGLPTVAEQRSPGAGKGGDQGSGGELLTGIGAGVKHTTVGNTGVAGLGGIGKAGAGGGEGGFGRSYVGSGGAGGAKSLADVHLAKDVELEGGLDRAVIQATIAKYLSQVRACYERGLAAKPGLAGQVTMDFEIAATGKLSFAKVKTSTLDYPDTEHCIASAMLSWQFPKPVGGTLTSVSYPFMLKPTNYM